MVNFLSILEKIGYNHLINSESVEALMKLGEKVKEDQKKSYEEMDNALKNDPKLNTDFSKGIIRSVDNCMKIKQ
jgi:hypothetical protein